MVEDNVKDNVENKAENIYRLPPHEDKHAHFKGKYYVISYGTDISAGKIISINSNKIILNPFKGYRYDPKEGKLGYLLIEEESEVELINPLFIKYEPTTRKTLEFICKELNEEKDRIKKNRDKQDESEK